MQAFLITQLARFLTNVPFWQQVKDAVMIAESTTMSSSEKKQWVFNILKTDAVLFGNFLISLAIELGVAYFKAQSGTLK